MPNGQPRRSLDGSLAMAYLSFKPKVVLESGLAQVWSWYVGQPV
jgi:hypothetical protein